MGYGGVSDKVYKRYRHRCFVQNFCFNDNSDERCRPVDFNNRFGNFVKDWIWMEEEEEVAKVLKVHKFMNVKKKATPVDCREMFMNADLNLRMKSKRRCRYSATTGPS